MSLVGQISTALVAVATEMKKKVNASSLATVATSGAYSDLSGKPTIPTLNYLNAFGDGSDGAVAFDGTNTFAFASKSGSIYTLTRNVHATTFSVSAGVTVISGSWIIFGTVSFANSGLLGSSGGNGQANGTGGGASTDSGGPLGGGQAGGAGTTTVGTAGTAAQGPGGTAGAGGAGSSGAGGAAGVTSIAATFTALFRSPLVGLSGIFTAFRSPRSVTGPGGGGGGGGDGTNKGGGGGASGGVVVISAPSIVNNGTIAANGGNGGTPTTGNCGGGGSGAGGTIVTYSLTAPTGTGTMTANAGTAGLKVGTGVNGSAGAAGTVLNVVLV